MLDLGLQGKKALVTGGGTGIGRAIAVALARECVDVAVASRNPDPEAIREIESHGVKGLRLVADVSKEDQVVKMVEDAIEGLGGLDLYINNSAAHWDEPVTKISSDGWINSINTNLSGCVWACREVSKHFIAQGEGSVLIVGSCATWNPLHKETGYRVSKTGLVAYMGVLAVELAAYRIRINMLTPGFFPTAVSAHLGGEKLKQVLDGIPLRRAGKTDELAWPALLLLSDKLSGFTTGAEWVVDGGQTLRPLPFYSDEEIRGMNA
ncbi:MAG: SDR family NAD(P)-dependent oxidoreductase [Armatimonadota bacterium]